MKFLLKKLIFVMLFASIHTAIFALTFGLSNKDPREVFYYWMVPSTHSENAQMATTQVQNAERHEVAPHETRVENLKPDEMLVGVFVPWDQALNFRSHVLVGFLFASEIPAGQTIILTNQVWATFNAGRSFEIALQDFGLAVPQFDLEGQASDWNKVTPVATFGASFRPRVSSINHDGNQVETRQPQGLGGLKIASLQAVFFDHGLWMRIVQPGLPADVKVSFFWRLTFVDQTWAGLEVPDIAAASGSVDLWNSGKKEAASVGTFDHRNDVWVIWVPLDRLEKRLHHEIKKAEVAFSELMRFNGENWELHFVDYSHSELP